MDAYSAYVKSLEGSESVRRSLTSPASTEPSSRAQQELLKLLLRSEADLHESRGRLDHCVHAQGKLRLEYHL